MASTVDTHVTPQSLPRANWLITLGVLLIALGLFACTYSVTATLASVVITGALITAAGLFQLLHAVSVKGWRSTLLWSLSGVLYLVAGVLMVTNPLVSAALLTLLLGALLIASGAFKIWVWTQNRSTQGAGWLALSGLLTLMVGLLISADWPANSPLILGIILGIDLLFQGWTLLLFGIALKKRSTEAL